MATYKKCGLDADKFMRVVFRIEKPCWIPSHEAVRIIHSDQKHGLKKWKFEDTQDTQYTGLNIFFLEVFLPVGGTLWFKLAVFDIWLDPELLHVEEFSRSLELHGGSRLVDIKYNEKAMKVKFMGHHLNIAVPIKDIGIFEPRPGGWDMTNDDLRPEQYHRAEYYSVDGRLRCRIIDPPRPKFAEMEKKLGASDTDKTKPSSDESKTTETQSKADPEDGWESDEEDEGKITTSKAKQYRKRVRGKKQCGHIGKFENLMVQVASFLGHCNERFVSSSSSTSTVSDNSITAKIPTQVDTRPKAIFPSETGTKVRIEPKDSSSRKAYISANSDISESSSNDAYTSAMSDINVSSSENVHKVVTCDVGTCTSVDDFVGDISTVNLNNNMADGAPQDNSTDGQNSLAQRCLKYALPLGLAGVIGAWVLFRK